MDTAKESRPMVNIRTVGTPDDVNERMKAVFEQALFEAGVHGGEFRFISHGRCLELEHHSLPCMRAEPFSNFGRALFVRLKVTKKPGSAFMGALHLPRDTDVDQLIANLTPVLAKYNEAGWKDVLPPEPPPEKTTVVAPVVAASSTSTRAATKRAFPTVEPVRPSASGGTPSLGWVQAQLPPAPPPPVSPPMPAALAPEPSPSPVQTEAQPVEQLRAEEDAAATLPPSSVLAKPEKGVLSQLAMDVVSVPTASSVVLRCRLCGGSKLPGLLRKLAEINAQIAEVAPERTVNDILVDVLTQELEARGNGSR